MDGEGRNAANLPATSPRMGSPVQHTATSGLWANVPWTLTCTSLCSAGQRSEIQMLASLVPLWRLRGGVCPRPLCQGLVLAGIRGESLQFLPLSLQPCVSVSRFPLLIRTRQWTGSALLRCDLILTRSHLGQTGMKQVFKWVGLLVLHLAFLVV